MIWYLVAIAFASASISYTIGGSSVFLWLRDWLGSKHKILDQFINCPWCIAHWISLGILLITELVNEYWSVTIQLTELYIVDFLFTWFVIMMEVGICHFFIGNAYDGKESSFFRAKRWAQKNQE